MFDFDGKVPLTGLIASRDAYFTSFDAAGERKIAA